MFCVSRSLIGWGQGTLFKKIFFFKGVHVFCVSRSLIGWGQGALFKKIFFFKGVHVFCVSRSLVPWLGARNFIIIKKET